MKPNCDKSQFLRSSDNSENVNTSDLSSSSEEENLEGTLADSLGPGKEVDFIISEFRRMASETASNKGAHSDRECDAQN